MANGALRVNTSSVHDSGTYVCMAENKAGTAFGEVRLLVHGTLSRNY